MSRLLDQIIVIDIESTCWEKATPEGQENEIIEIGISLVDLKSKEIKEKRSIIVKPQYSEVSLFCTNLTTLTQEDVNKGISFNEACNILRKEYLSQKRTWLSWGDYDRKQFEKQCKKYEIAYPFSPTHINLKNLFALLNSQNHEVGMNNALEILNIPLEGTHHRGIDDAHNIAKIFIHLLKSFSITPL